MKAVFVADDGSMAWGMAETPVLGPGEVRKPLPWEDLNREQKEFQATKMAIHAAMIHRMDIESAGEQNVIQGFFLG